MWGTQLRYYCSTFPGVYNFNINMSGTVVSHIGAKIWVLFMRVGDTREAFEAVWLTEQLESEIN